MTKKRSLNRKEIRGLKKKGIALAMFLALTFSAVPINAAIVSAATDSATYVEEATTTFTFTNEDVTAEAGDESSYTIDGTNLTITKSGTYILTGSCAEGSVTVKKGTQNVTLVLQDLDLASSSGAPITINKNNSNTKIIIAGTNTLTDNEDPADEESTDEAVADAFEGAAIKLKSNGSLLITGDGVLNINGNCKNGIKGADSSTITIGADADDTFTLNVDAANDGISSNGSESQAGLEIIGGNINIDAADDGIKSDYIVNIGQEGTDEGATINITNSYEGIEGAIVNLYGGNATVVSSDDGINAANSELGEDYAFSLNIYGGAWDIDAGGDGVDSNGTITVSGGTTDVSSSTQDDNNAIDWGDNSTITVTGGTIIGVGMGQMQQGFTNGRFVMFSAELSAGNTISVVDSNGNELYTTTVKKSANSVIFSNEDLVSNASYSLKVNGNTVVTSTEGEAINGMEPGGIQPGGMQPGGMQPGGMQPGGMRPDEIGPDGIQQGSGEVQESQEIVINSSGNVTSTLLVDSSLNIPADATFSVNKIESGELYDLAASIVKSQYSGSKFDVYDFSLTSGNVEYHDLGGTVEVRIDPPAGLTEEELAHYKVFAVVDGKLVLCDTEYKDGKICFKTNHFSTYVGVVVPETDSTKNTSSQGDNQTSLTTSAATTTTVSAPKTSDVLPYVAVGVTLAGASVAGVTFYSRRKKN